jgi:hypothetical protein
MGILKPKMAASLRTIRDILIRDWDPIGVRELRGAEDEYDAYVMPIYQLLRQSPSEAALTDHLYQIETKHMGLTRFGRAQLKPVVDHLLKLDVSTDEPVQ